MASSVSKKALEQIKEKEIQPRAKWQFALRNILFWCAFVLSVLLGARFFGAVLFILFEIEPELFISSFDVFLKLMLGLFPSVWFTVFLLFVLLAVLGLQKTAGGYRISIKKLVLANIVNVMILGGIFFAVGDGKRFEKQAQKLPFYTAVDDKREVFWGVPDDGRLVGKIVSFEDEAFTLEDPKQTVWLVLYTNELELTEGARVRVIGSVVDGDDKKVFEAEEILLWEPRKKPPRKPGARTPQKKLEKSERNFEDMRMKEWRGQSI